MEQKLERKIQQLNRIQDSPQLLSDLFANNERNSSQYLIMPHLKTNTMLQQQYTARSWHVPYSAEKGQGTSW
jgi:hypothetical protein